VVKTTTETQKQAGMTDAAVRKATGKGWDEWFAILDKAGAQKMKHKDIALWLDEHYGEMGGWWAQMVAVGYEQARGLRDKHQKPNGYEISVGRTIAAPVAMLFKAWTDARTRKRWLSESITIRKTTENKSMRVTWEDNETILSVNFYPKGDAKCQVVVQHTKLPNAQAAKQMKTFWSEVLEQLKEKMKA
jgi:uncharacterized protein YndB with AHSA1/START domain